jgi:hypothetical protein
MNTDNYRAKHVQRVRCLLLTLNHVTTVQRAHTAMTVPRAKHVQRVRCLLLTHNHVTTVQRAHTAMTVPHAKSALQANTRINPVNHRAKSALQANTRMNPANHRAKHALKAFQSQTLKTQDVKGAMLEPPTSRAHMLLLNHHHMNANLVNL